MADVENPDPDLAAAEPDVESQCDTPCGAAFCACTVVAASVILVVLFCRSGHASTGVQVMAAAGLVLAVMGLVAGVVCCALSLDYFVHGNPLGQQQPLLPPPAAAAVD
ncbi:hypothetical protein ZWY2020_026342 [Hordeum vulgare]|uniref:Transmembrane protein n=1 Tax=Hordeum vulgare subsp. vulgare TaxID=112509 RepID=A0A8I6XE22_HORVV|nr:hypothetical protein ZWY2020_046743 [Hordeum vulgare]KAI5001692.1 hypothetical protein ZWY2020_026342 [Hordeum vulgare]